MKKHIYSAALIAILSITFNMSSAKAAPAADCYRAPERGKGGATCLPINSNIVFLLVAGVFIGIATVTKTKSLKAN